MRLIVMNVCRIAQSTETLKLPCPKNLIKSSTYTTLKNFLKNLLSLRFNKLLPNFSCTK